MCYGRRSYLTRVIHRDVRSPSWASSLGVALPAHRSMTTRRRAQRPVAAVERILYTRDEAATALGMSVDTFERRVVSYEWKDWKSEVIWMSLYFSVAVWLSISLIHAPPSGTRASDKPPLR